MDINDIDSVNNMNSVNNTDMYRPAGVRGGGSVSASIAGADEKARRLIAEMLAGHIFDIKPQLDFTTELGFAYPTVENLLGVTSQQAVEIMEWLTQRGILEKTFFDRLIRCPQCQALNLRPTTRCSRCGSANIAHGRILEHFICQHVGLEDEFISKGKYVCPKCGVELRAIGSDYQTLGLLYKCRDCDNVFNLPLIRWQCMKCSSLTDHSKVAEVNIYSYSFNEQRRGWLEFEFRPKPRLIEYLRHQGYEVTENARVLGRSGAEHNIDILATRDDGVITHNIAIGVELTGQKIGMEKIFNFDDKVYDAGIHDKVLLVVPELTNEAYKFAQQQKIKVVEIDQLDEVLSGEVAGPGELAAQPFVFRSKSQLMEYLKKRGYEVKENAEVKGRSGAIHNIDILATRDEGIVVHHIAIGVAESASAVELSEVFGFDDKTYDIGIRNKVFIAVPGLSREARQFAIRQRIKVIEAKAIEPPANS